MMPCAAAPSTFGESRGRVIFGAMVMLVGGYLLAERFDWWGVHFRVPVWPWILLALGVAGWRGSDGEHQPVSRMALWFIAIGMWGLVTEYHLFGSGPRSGWPLLVLLAGAFIVWRAVDPPSHRCGRGERS